MPPSSPNAHRDLRIGARGPDVERVQAAANHRLRARNQRAYLCTVDGDFGPKTARAVSRALFVLGCTHKTVAAASVHGGGHVTVAGQRLCRHPQLRNHRQMEESRKRLHQIRDTSIHEVPVAHGIQLCTDAAELGLKHAPEVHYTQGPQRWEGIANRDHAAKGQFPHYADCSAFFSWCLWQLLGEGDDTVNGAHWVGGYTGTLLAHGKRVAHPIEGAAVLYGQPGSTGEHVAYSKGNGRVISHGSEGGPYDLPYNYRRDVMEFRVYA